MLISIVSPEFCVPGILVSPEFCRGGLESDLVKAVGQGGGQGSVLCEVAIDRTCGGRARYVPSGLWTSDGSTAGNAGQS